MMVSAIPAPFELPDRRQLRDVEGIISEAMHQGRGRHCAGAQLAQILRRALDEHLGEVIPSRSFTFVTADYRTLRIVLGYRRGDGSRGTILVTIIGIHVLITNAVHPFATTIDEALFGPSDG